jgi:hypothetical protein
MKRFILLHAVCALLSHGATGQIPDLSKETPIIIYKDAAEADSVLMNMKQYDRNSLGKWLAETSSKFGRKDPVIIIVERETSIGAAADLFQLAKQSHDRVYAVIKAYALSLPMLLFSTDDRTDISQLVWVMPKAADGFRSPRVFIGSKDPNGLFIEPPKELIEQLAKPREK